MHTAAEGGLHQVCKHLIEQGVDVNAMASEGQTPLSLAICARDEATSVLLVDHGAHNKIVGQRGSMLHLSAKKGLLMVCKALIYKGAEVNERSGGSEKHVIHCAALSANPGIVKLIVDQSADVNARDARKNTPLHLIFETPGTSPSDVLQCALVLLDHGADVNAINIEDKSPLHLISRKISSALGSHEICRLLVARGANVNGKDHKGDAPLYCVLYSPSRREESLEMVRFLIEQGADINALAIDGRPLHLCLARSKFRCASLLLQAGADVYAKDGNDRTSVDFANILGRHQLAQALQAVPIFVLLASIRSLPRLQYRQRWWLTLDLLKQVRIMYLHLPG
jgi:ankyrin repeat protein